MRIGPLRHRVTIERNTPTITNHERVDSWSTLFEVWADKRDPKGDEAVQALAVESSMTVQFVIRYRSGITAEDRLIFKTRTFDIKGVTNPDGRNCWLVLYCKEHRSDGD